MDVGDGEEDVTGEEDEDDNSRSRSGIDQRL